MPRAIEFEIETALGAAMTEFRHRGFGGTSIKALERATGLSSGSLYNSFGDKEAIFVKALSHYNRVVVAQRIDDYLTGMPPGVGLRSFFLSLLDEPNNAVSGCLLTNSAVEFGESDSIASEGVRTGFQLQERALASTVRRLFPGAPDADKKALKLLALCQGVLVLVRFGHSKPQLEAMITNELDLMIGENNV